MGVCELRGVFVGVVWNDEEMTLVGRWVANGVVKVGELNDTANEVIDG